MLYMHLQLVVLLYSTSQIEFYSTTDTLAYCYLHVLPCDCTTNGIKLCYSCYKS